MKGAWEKKRERERSKEKKERAKKRKARIMRGIKTKYRENENKEIKPILEVKKPIQDPQRDKKIY
jgi:hypothetical protein